MKKKFRVIIIFLCMAITSLALILLPGPVSGDWTGTPLKCLCDAHHFIRISGNTVVYYSEYETNFPPCINVLKRNGNNSYTWEFLEWIPPHDGLPSSIRTNHFIIQPHLLHMKFSLGAGKCNEWLHRDFSSEEKSQILSSIKAPEEFSATKARLEHGWQNRKTKAIQ